MTRDEVLAIPDLKRDGLRNVDIASKYGVSLTTVNYWIKRLRNEGVEVKRLPHKGRQKMKLT